MVFTWATKGGSARVPLTFRATIRVPLGSPLRAAFQEERLPVKVPTTPKDPAMTFLSPQPPQRFRV